MRTMLLTMGFFGLLAASAPAARADDQTDARAIVEKGIKAVGGEEKLAKFKAYTFKEKGTYYGMGAGLPYTSEGAVQFPGQFKMEIQGVFTLVIDGDKGWMKTGDQTTEMTEDQLAEQKAGHYTGYVCSLSPLKDKDYTLATTGETKIEDRPALGVKVSKKGQADVTLYFDKETGRLAKAETRGKTMGEEALNEHFFGDYKEVEGCMIPMKVSMKRDGKIYVEAEVHDMKPHGKLDAAVSPNLKSEIV